MEYHPNKEWECQDILLQLECLMEHPQWDILLHNQLDLVDLESALELVEFM